MMSALRRGRRSLKDAIPAKKGKPLKEFPQKCIFSNLYLLPDATPVDRAIEYDDISPAGQRGKAYPFPSGPLGV
jgi:hypothetical protein